MINKYLSQTNKQEVKTWISTALAKRLNKDPSKDNQSEIEHIIDYLNSDRAPVRLQKMSYIQAKVNTDKWLTSLQKKGRNLVDTDTDVEIVKRYKSGLRLVKLVSENSYKREGTLMGHCVASYYGKKDTTIYSLRDFNNNPHCTIEILNNGRDINQIKGKGNGSIHPNYIKTIIAVLKHFKLEVRDSEMGNLGYTKVSPEDKQLIEKFVTGAQYYKDVWFYNYSSVKPKAGA